jgi:hypothetical protein
MIFADMSQVAKLSRDLLGAAAAMEEVSDVTLDKVVDRCAQRVDLDA